MKFFSRVGVLLTAHGLQSMGGIYMPRYAALIEVFPPGYMDFAFNLLLQACNLWYYELQGVMPKHLEQWYKKKCGNKLKSFFDKCGNVKNMDVTADVPEVLRTVRIDVRMLGHDMTRVK